jgi:HlyD family secretion protein
MRKFVIPALAVLAILFGVGMVVQNHPRRESTSPPSPPPARPFEHTVAAVGLVETSTENIAIGTPIAEIAAEVYAVVGLAVKRGDPLFKLDDRHLRATLAARQAELAVAERQVEVERSVLADLTHTRDFAEKLKDRRSISEEELTRRRSAVDTAGARLEEARSRVASAEAQVKMVQVDLERSVVRAPVDGEVIQVKIHPGEFAPAGVTEVPLVVLGRLKPLYLRVDVDEHEAWRIRSAAPAVASVRGNADQRARLSFVRFEPFVIPKKSLTGDNTERVDTRVLQIIYRLEDGGLALFVGQQMDVYIEARDTGSPGKELAR